MPSIHRNRKHDTRIDPRFTDTLIHSAWGVPSTVIPAMQLHPFAVHEDTNTPYTQAKRWNVTHIPSGGYILRRLHRGDAFLLAQHLFDHHRANPTLWSFSTREEFNLVRPTLIPAVHSLVARLEIRL